MFEVADTDAAPQDGNVVVAAAFTLDGNQAELAASVSVTCNGVTLEPNGLLGNAARVPLVAAGATYTFVYTRAGEATTVSVAAQPRPVVTAPAANATITRTTMLTLTYQAGSGTSVRGSASSSASTTLGASEPDNGSYDAFDVSALSAGPGTVSIERELDSNLSNSGFKSAQTVITTSSTTVPVTWN